MDLRQLEFVLAVEETLSFTRAAERCHVVQSALSHQVQRLEAELGVRLFERTSRSVQTTEAGEVVARYARRILSSVQEAQAELDALTGLMRGRVALGATQTAGRALDVVALCGRFHRVYPGVAMSVISGPAEELVGQVRGGGLDVALVTGCRETPGLIWRTVSTPEVLVAVVSRDHPLASREIVSLAELAADNGEFVEFRRGTGLANHVGDVFARFELPRSVAVELGQISDMVRFAANSLAVAIVPRAFTTDLAAHEPNAVALSLEEHVELPVQAVTRRARGSAARRAFLDDLETHAGELVRSIPSFE